MELCRIKTNKPINEKEKYKLIKAVGKNVEKRISLNTSFQKCVKEEDLNNKKS